MLRLSLFAATAIALVSCSQTEKSTAVGAASGAIIGGVVSDDWRGAAVGAAVGGAAGALVGKASEPGDCIYRDAYGRRYTDRC